MAEIMPYEEAVKVWGAKRRNAAIDRENELRGRMGHHATWMVERYAYSVQVLGEIVEAGGGAIGRSDG